MKLGGKLFLFSLANVKCGMKLYEYDLCCLPSMCKELKILIFLADNLVDKTRK